MIRLFHTKIGFYRIYPSGFYVDPKLEHLIQVKSEDLNSSKFKSSELVFYSLIVCILRDTIHRF